MLGYYLKVAAHNTRRNKVLSTLMVLAIAVGIGASMTTLTVMRLLSGDPLPGRSGNLYYPQVDVNPDSKGQEPYDVMDYRTAHDLWRAKRADQQTLVAESQVKVREATGNLPPRMYSLASVTSDFFGMFDVPMQFGRGWSPEDDASRARVVVISDALNERLFAGRNSVGQTLRLADSDVRIVGVLGPWRPSPLFYKVRGGRFANGETSGFYSRADDVFMPFDSSLEVNRGNFQPFTCWSPPDSPGQIETSPCVWVALWVKLAAPQEVAAYKRFLDGYAAEQKASGRIKVAENTRLRNLMGWLDFNRVVPNDVKLQTLLAFGFLAICLFNVVGLLLAKFMRYSGEIGLRRALGATKRAIFAQCLAESAMIGIVGGLGGICLTLAGLGLVRSQDVQYADFVHLDVPMFLLTIVCALITSLLAGVIPAFRASQVPTALQLKML